MRAYPPASLMFLASLGAEVAEGHYMPPPSRARNSQTFSSARGFSQNPITRLLKHIYFEGEQFPLKSQPEVTDKFHAGKLTDNR